MIDEKTRAAQKDANMGLGRQTAAALEAIVDQLVLLNANLAALTRAAETASRAGGARRRRLSQRARAFGAGVDRG